MHMLCALAKTCVSLNQHDQLSSEVEQEDVYCSYQERDIVKKECEPLPDIDEQSEGRDTY